MFPKLFLKLSPKLSQKLSLKLSQKIVTNMIVIYKRWFCSKFQKTGNINDVKIYGLKYESHACSCAQTKIVTSSNEASVVSFQMFFCFFHRKLRKPRVTRIHMNLFASMILQCVVRLVIYADQLIVRQPSQTNVKNPENSTTTQRCLFTSIF